MEHSLSQCRKLEAIYCGLPDVASSILLIMTDNSSHDKIEPHNGMRVGTGDSCMY